MIDTFCPDKRIHLEPFRSHIQRHRKPSSGIIPGTQFDVGICTACTLVLCYCLKASAVAL